jgi:hypothetical protein
VVCVINCSGHRLNARRTQIAGHTTERWESTPRQCVVYRAYNTDVEQFLDET